MDKIVLCLIGFFFVLGGIDAILGNRLTLGEKFEEGIKMMGTFAMCMLGIYSLAPVMAKFCAAVIVPVSGLLHVDPSIIPAIFLAIDLGGYPVATGMALNKDIGMLSGICIASSLGAALNFSIPVASGMIAKEDKSYFFKGVTIGIISLPIGLVLAGLFQGMNIGLLLWNLTPIFVFAVILAIGLLQEPKLLIRCFALLGKIIVSISIVGLLLQGISFIFDIQLVAELAPLSAAMLIVGKSAFILAGAYPLLSAVTRLFKNHFEQIGERTGMNDVSIAGMMGNLANNILVFGTYSRMNPKGKLVCGALTISCSFLFGGQLGFVLSVAPEQLNLFIVFKLTSGIVSIILAVWLYEYEAKKRTAKGD